MQDANSAVAHRAEVHLVKERSLRCQMVAMKIKIAQVAKNMGRTGRTGRTGTGTRGPATPRTP